MGSARPPRSAVHESVSRACRRGRRAGPVQAASRSREPCSSAGHDEQRPDVEQINSGPAPCPCASGSSCTPPSRGAPDGAESPHPVKREVAREVAGVRVERGHAEARTKAASEIDRTNKPCSSFPYAPGEPFGKDGKLTLPVMLAAGAHSTVKVYCCVSRSALE